MKLYKKLRYREEHSAYLHFTHWHFLAAHTPNPHFTRDPIFAPAQTLRIVF